MTLLTKLGLSVLGGGSVAAGGYGVYESIRPKTIADQLKWEGFTLGYVGDDANHEDIKGEGLWKKLSDEYKKSNTQQNDKFKGEEGTGVSNINDENKLKGHCKKIFMNPKSDTDNLEKAKLWCVRNSTKLTSGK